MEADARGAAFSPQPSAFSHTGLALCTLRVFRALRVFRVLRALRVLVSRVLLRPDLAAVPELHRLRGRRQLCDRGPALGPRAGAVRGGDGPAPDRRRRQPAASPARDHRADRRGAGGAGSPSRDHRAYRVPGRAVRRAIGGAACGPGAPSAVRRAGLFSRAGGRSGPGPLRRLGQPAGALRCDLRLPGGGEGGDAPGGRGDAAAALPALRDQIGAPRRAWAEHHRAAAPGGAGAPVWATLAFRCWSARPRSEKPRWPWRSRPTSPSRWSRQTPGRSIVGSISAPPSPPGGSGSGFPTTAWMWWIRGSGTVPAGLRGRPRGGSRISGRGNGSPSWWAVPASTCAPWPKGSSWSRRSTGRSAEPWSTGSSDSSRAS